MVSCPTNGTEHELKEYTFIPEKTVLNMYGSSFWGEGEIHFK